jgi:hypothetical protein
VIGAPLKEGRGWGAPLKEGCGRVRHRCGRTCTTANAYIRHLSSSRDKVIFDGNSPSMRSIHRSFLDELVCWVMAGAKGLGSRGL